MSVRERMVERERVVSKFGHDRWDREDWTETGGICRLQLSPSDGHPSPHYGKSPTQRRVSHNAAAAIWPTDKSSIDDYQRKKSAVSSAPSNAARVDIFISLTSKQFPFRLYIFHVTLKTEKSHFSQVLETQVYKNVVFQK